ncbi:MAG: NAD(P)-dependent glycerol-3-phosphate dehydrogenase [Firmicutes bacterium]|nr:NAD(P)-dependent glycerol-3-phosphate dehydrogenase [Bacillota bacterium]MDD4264181.1 NAD(P)-dependent glycerol-3-phosphate dehydrogenase [Bacillota bacterium]MDD4693570.1 NAD(P)-dependent glycerol-3-phosphate dehydrogenase [Bacillota bacterium]
MQNTGFNSLAIVGAGGWGSALSVSFATIYKEIFIWAYSKDVCDEINDFHTNNSYLSDISFPENIRATNSFEFLRDHDLVLLMVPAQHMRSVVKNLKPYLKKGAVLVHGAKGIEKESLKRISEVIIEETEDKHPVLVLSGPTHAEEVARNMPTACVLAGTDEELVKEIQERLILPTFRIYTSLDVVGVEIGGSLKNVIAIATGIADGIGYGDNARGALITRGLAEMARLGVKIGANPLTFAGLSGMGDLIATCTSEHSRNRNAGILLAKGNPVEDITTSSKMVVEGAHTVFGAYQLGLREGVELPIVKEVLAVIEGKKAPKEIAPLLMQRQAQEELNYLLENSLTF